MKKVLTERTSNRIKREGCNGREQGKDVEEGKRVYGREGERQIVIQDIRRSELKFHWYQLF